MSEKLALTFVCLSFMPGQIQAAAELLERTNSFAAGVLRSEFRIRSWTSEDGLPQNTINCLFQANNGYLWIGTRNGLVRFDGVKFKVFDTRNTPALVNHDIQAVCESPPGTLWIGTREGLVRYEEHRFSEVPLLNGERVFVHSICARKGGGIWLGTDVGPIQHKSGESILLPNYPRYEMPFYLTPASKVAVDELLEDSSGALWLRDPRGVLRLAPGARDFEIVHAPDAKTGSPYTGSGFAEDGSGGIWFGWTDGLYRWEGGKLEKFARARERADGSLAQGEPGHVVFSPGGDLWFADAWGGLSRMHGGRMIRYAPATGLSDELVTCLLPDREGNIWVGTAQGGFNCLQTRNVLNLTTANGLAHNSVWSIAEAHDGSVWIATEAGLSRYAAGKFETIKASAPDPETSNSWNRFFAVYSDRSGRIWAGGANVWQARSNELIPFDATLRIGARTLLEDRSGRLWFGDPDLCYFEKGKLTPVRATRAPPPAGWAIPSWEVTGILEDATGAIWVGTKAGVARMQGSKCEWFSPANGFPASYAAAALADDDGTVWFASDRGLIRGRNGRFFLFTTRHGLHENLVLNVLEDDSGWIWLNGHRGLQRLRKRDLNDVADGRANWLSGVHFGEADGMLSAEGNGGHLPNSCKTRDGRLWFPTIKGVVVVDPRTLNRDRAPPPVVIEQVIADGEIIYGDDRKEGAPMRNLPPGRARSFVFRYTANTFVHPGKMHFRYRLDGHDSDWQEDIGNLRTAFYTNLRPGNYRFSVVAMNENGVMAEREAEFAFYLAPHFYETSPFYVLCAAGLIAVGAGLHLARMRGVRRVQALEHQHALDLERRRIARDMHDGLGADLTKMALLADIAHARQPQAAGVSDFQKVSTLARELVDGINELVWATNPRHDTLENLASYIREFASDLLETAGLQYRFDFPRQFPERNVSGRTRAELFFAVKEALNNTVKHASASKVELTFRLSGDEVEIVVADDGCGFNPCPPVHDAATGQNGLRNMRERVEALGGNTRIESMPGRGARIILRAPLR